MKSQAKTKISVQSIAYIALFIAIIAICSWISIPFTVPLTLQIFAIFTAIGLLGTKRSFFCILAYLLLGLVGVPVFSGFRGGFAVLFGNTGGYIVGFLLSCLVSGPLIKKSKGNIIKMIASMVLGLFVCYIFGTAWFVCLYNLNTGSIGIISALSICVFPFIIPDIIKITLAALLTKRLSKYIRTDF